MKVMQVLIKKDVSKWMDSIAEAHRLGPSPGAITTLETSLREAIELVNALAEDYGVDASIPDSQVSKKAEPKVSSSSAPAAARKKKKSGS